MRSDALGTLVVAGCDPLSAVAACVVLAGVAPAAAVAGVVLVEVVDVDGTRLDSVELIEIN